MILAHTYLYIYGVFASLGTLYAIGRENSLTGPKLVGLLIGFILNVLLWVAVLTV